MKFLIALLAAACPFGVMSQSTFQDTTLLKPVEVTATRASDITPVTKTTLTKQQIDSKNYGPDLPFLLEETPGVVANSDAGNGIGYTGIRIRGADASRINITINGIPYNDAESQGSFLVNIPDIASSAGSIQIQRGVGTSTNGAGAFGATINLSTNEIKKNKSLQWNSSIGSFHSFKNTLSVNSGIIKRHWSFDGRLSMIRSNGYIDRAFSHLRSGYASVAYISNNNSVRFNYFTGKEKTYLAWNGIDAATLDTNRRYNPSGTEKPGTPYSNETDNYLQSHYQLFFNHKFSVSVKASMAIFLTRGKGYYEQYKANQKLSSYGLPDYNNGNNQPVSRTDLIRQLWLNNYFYGTILSAEYKKDNAEITAGISVTDYDGRHYGKIKWAEFQPAVPLNYEWYLLSAYKSDYAAYIKYTQRIFGNWYSYIDLQGRGINYKINGFRDHPDIKSRHQYMFFNPKAGITYRNGGMSAYISYGHSSKEPNRDDYEAGITDVPKPEKLNDFEAGALLSRKKNYAGINFYYMHYTDQLILTGKINDVGAYTRVNTPSSYRIGIESQFGVQLIKWASLSGNLCLSDSRVKKFTEYIDDYDNGGQVETIYENTPIAFSPRITGTLNISFTPIKHLEMNLISKYVGRQYLDNSGIKQRSLSPYFVEDFRISYLMSPKPFKELNIFFVANNLFSKRYEPNGYSYSYISSGRTTTENYYFPMALFNVMGGITIGL